jgi:hypothetical protein
LASTVTPIASKRIVCALGRTCVSSHSQAAARRRRRARWRGRRPARGCSNGLCRRECALSRLVFTSMKISTAPSKAIRSISPWRVRALRASKAKPRRRRCATASSSPNLPSRRRGSSRCGSCGCGSCGCGSCGRGSVARGSPGHRSLGPWRGRLLLGTFAHAKEPYVTNRAQVCPVCNRIVWRHACDHLARIASRP